LNSPELLRRINRLRQSDNYTNWFYLAREYLFLGISLGGTIAFYHWLEAAGLSWLWAVPVTLVAIVLAGAGQHRLATLTHEASHYMLFRSRLLNEIVSEWFCMFPLLAATHPYRVQHIGHHQYPNDPERDPDIVQLKMSGHRFPFPMTRARFVWECVIKQFLWLPSPIRYILARASYVVNIGETGPYALKFKRSPILRIVTASYFVTLIAVMAAGIWWDQPWLMAAVPAGMLAAMLIAYALIPERSQRPAPTRAVRHARDFQYASDCCPGMADRLDRKTVVALFHRLVADPAGNELLLLHDLAPARAAWQRQRGAADQHAHFSRGLADRRGGIPDRQRLSFAPSSLSDGAALQSP
jgi:fatty acid desaturase